VPRWSPTKALPAGARSVRDDGLSLKQIAQELGCSASLLGSKLRAATRHGLLAAIGEVSANGL